MRGKRVIPSLLVAAGLLAIVAPRVGGAGRESVTGSRPCWVFFRVPDGKLAPAAPMTLAPRAVSRLEKVGHVAGSDRADFSPDPTLFDPLRERGFIPRIRHVSRWLQAASLPLTPEEARELADDPRVRMVRPVARFVDSPLPEEIAVEPQGAAGKSIEVAADRDPRTLSPADYGPTWDQLDMLGVPEMHHLGLSGSGVMVALFDTGFYKDHVSLMPLAKVAERDFVRGDGDTQYDPHDPGDTRESNNHGTYTWSTLGGFDPGEQIGPAYRASFVLAKTEDVLREVHAEEDNYIAALEWADSLGVDIVSSSLGYRYFDDGSAYSFGELNGTTVPLTIATEVAASRGILVVTAMGNEGPDPGSLDVPADGKKVVSVGAVDYNRTIASFSSRGPTADGRIKPDVDAQGVAVACASAASPFTYSRASGTSLSTPLIAGLSALLLEAHPTWGPDSLIAALRGSGDHSSHPDNDMGWGTADGMRAIRASGARLTVYRHGWVEEDGNVDGIPGYLETGALRIWVRNIGGRASDAGTARVGIHDPIFSLIDSSEVALPAIAPADSAPVTVARLSIGDGAYAASYPIFVRLMAVGDTVDRKVPLVVIPSYSITRLRATAESFGTVRVEWTTSGDAILAARVYRSAPPDTSLAIVYEESVHRDQGEWLDRPPLPGTYQYWVSARLIGGGESALLGPEEAVTSIPSRMQIGRPYPNPARRGSVSIPLAWTSTGLPRIEIYDVAGRLVRTIRGSDPGPGFPLLAWDLRADDGRAVASGWYIVRAPGIGSARLLIAR